MLNPLFLKVNPLQKEQIREIVEIEKEVMHNPWTEKLFISGLNDFTVVFCAQYEDEVAGFIWAQRVENEAEIFKVAVTERFQRRGIGNVLLETFINYCKNNGVNTLYLEVSSKNLKAIKLYKKQGFTENGRRKNYYGSDNDALLLVYEL